MSEMRSLFAALASDLHATDPTASIELDLSISKLNRSLNLTESPGLGVLDTALSLMCFTAPQVCDSLNKYTLKTMVAVLSSSIDCKLLGGNNEPLLRVGGSISQSDCERVLELCADILGKMKGEKGKLCKLLLYAVVRAAALAVRFPQAVSRTSQFEMKNGESVASAIEKLSGQFEDDFTIKIHEIPLRLMLWHLDPIIWRQDLSQMLQEYSRRPFISLSTEIYNRMELRSKIFCLTVSPYMFIETRVVLHSWFLTTGLVSVMEFQTQLVGLVLDIISRPMWWGISGEVGSKLPFSHAYFPYEHNLVRILIGPISQENFLQLLDKISCPVSRSGGLLPASSSKSARKSNIIGHTSAWATVMNFTGWFSYASMLLFSRNYTENSLHFGFIFSSVKPCLDNDMGLSWPALAAKFIAWILNPISESYQNCVVDCLTKASELWTTKCFSTSNNNKDGVLELTTTTVAPWLKRFQELYNKLVVPKVAFSTSNSKISNIGSYLLRRIPLGILLIYADSLNPEACSLLLHYAAIGSTRNFSDIKNLGQSHKRLKCDFAWTEDYNSSEAIAGCKIVFDVTDTAHGSISASMFETDEDRLNFVCRIKMKTGDYLLRCVKRLLSFEVDGDYGVLMQRDLFTRVVRWRHLGRDVFPNNKDFDFVCAALNK